MEPDPLRRDRAWSRPERASAPKWPALAVGIIITGVALLFLLAALYAGSDYASAVISSFTPSETPQIAHVPDAPTLKKSNPDEPMWLPAPGERARATAEVVPVEQVAVSETPQGSVAEAAKVYAKGQQRLAVTSGQAALKAVSDWLQEDEQWREQVEPLLKNDDGRKIAANVELVDQFQAVISEDRPAPERAVELERIVKELLEPLQKVAENKDDLSATPAGIEQSFEKYRAQAMEAHAALKKLRGRVAAILRKAGSLTPATVTLEQALDDREASLAEAEVKERTNALAGEREEAARMRIAAESEALRMKSEQEQAAIRAQAEKDKLIARAKTPEVRRYLATFLAKGYFQPTGSYASIKYERTTEELPVSFTRINSSGSLDKSIQGLRPLAILASPGFSPPNSWHDRPAWQFDLSTFSWSKSDQEFIQRAQDLLRELGPTLVELKMLAP